MTTTPSLHQVPTSCLKLETSMFNFRPIPPKTALEKSRTSPPLVSLPIVVYERSASEFHLMIGDASVVPTSSETIPALVIPTQKDGCRPFQIFLEMTDKLSRDAEKVWFISHLKRFGIERTDLQNQFLPLLGFESHPRVYRKLEKADRLAPSVLAFCYQKKFSLKQLFYLSRFESDWLVSFVALSDTLHLTASIFMELCELITDDSKASSTELSTFFTQDEIVTALQSETSPQARTDALRKVMKRRRLPIVTAINEEISTTVKSLNLPHNMAVTWDPSLEQTDVRVTISLKSSKDLDVTKDFTSRAIFYEGLYKILNKL